MHDKECIAVPQPPPARAFELGGGVQFLAGPKSVAP
jgi:hypothetical protein